MKSFFSNIGKWFSIVPVTEYAPLKPKKRDTKENMMDALFMAQKKRWRQLVMKCFMSVIRLHVLDYTLSAIKYWLSILFVLYCIVLYCRGDEDEEENEDEDNEKLEKLGKVSYWMLLLFFFLPISFLPSCPYCTYKSYCTFIPAPVTLRWWRDVKTIRKRRIRS